MAKIAAIGDIHVRLDNGSYARLFKEIGREADVLILCGDLTDSGHCSEAEKLVEELKGVHIPVLALLGNHDHESGEEEKIRAVLRAARIHFLDEEAFVYEDVAFAGVKGFGGGFGKHSITAFGESSIKRFVGESVQEALRLGALLDSVPDKKLVAALHYAPIAATVAGEPQEIFPFLGSSHLMDTIDRFPVSIVFHGHAHHGAHFGKTARGIPVYNVARTVLQTQAHKEYFLTSV